MKYAGVVVDNNTNATDAIYTYKTDLEDIRIGQKVTVPFSMHDRRAEGYVVSLSDEAPEGVSVHPATPPAARPRTNASSATTSAWGCTTPFSPHGFSTDLRTTAWKST